MYFLGFGFQQKGSGVCNSILSRLFLTVSLFALACVPSLAQAASVEEAARALPDRIGDFRARGPADGGESGLVRDAENLGIVSQARRSYVSTRGETYDVGVVKTKTDSGAYSLLTDLVRTHRPPPVIKQNEVGAASASRPGAITFFKGPAVVDVAVTGNSANGESAPPLDFARVLAEGLDAGEGGIPVLALHLPEWEKVQGRVDYVLSTPALKSIVGQQPILDEVSFEGGAEAVTAAYGDARLVIIEFTTPQYAQDNDARIAERITQLRAAAQTAPTAYKRVGNYAVFVFGAQDEGAAVGLIDQVKYEKDIRWLGDNPHVAEQAEKFYKTTMAGVVVTTLKVTGIAVLVCLGVGVVFGGAVFLYRRTRPGAREVYSDAGGMLRLNIQDVNSSSGSSKLLSEGGKR